jgi:hypothetical protein
MNNHTDICDILNDGPCTCRTVRVRLAGDGLTSSNGAPVPEKDRTLQDVLAARDYSQAVRIHFGRYGRCGELL